MKRGQARRGRNSATGGVRVARGSDDTSSAFATEVNDRRLLEAVLSDAPAPVQGTVAV